MARQKVAKPTTPDNFPEKYWKKLSTTWRDAALAKQTKELESEILKAEQTIAFTEKEMEADAKLAAAKEQVKDLAGGYKDVLTGENAKIKYCLYLMEGRGAPVSSDDSSEED